MPAYPLDAGAADLGSRRRSGPRWTCCRPRSGSTGFRERGTPIGRCTGGSRPRRRRRACAWRSPKGKPTAQTRRSAPPWIVKAGNDENRGPIAKIGPRFRFQGRRGRVFRSRAGRLERHLCAGGDLERRGRVAFTEVGLSRGVAGALRAGQVEGAARAGRTRRTAGPAGHPPLPRARPDSGSSGLGRRMARIPDSPSCPCSNSSGGAVGYARRTSPALTCPSR